MDLRPRSSPTFSRAGPQWRPFGQAAGRPALSDAGAAADSGKNSSSQLRASRFVALSLEAFYDSSYTSSDGKTGYIWFLLYRMRGESQELSTSSVSLRLTASPHRGSCFMGKAPGRGPGGFHALSNLPLWMARFSYAAGLIQFQTLAVRAAEQDPACAAGEAGRAGRDSVSNTTPRASSSRCACARSVTARAI